MIVLRPLRSTKSKTSIVFCVLSVFLTVLFSVAGQACVAARTTPAAKAVAEPASRPAPLVFPGAEWEKIADPAIARYSASGLEAVREYLKTIPTTGLVVATAGRILLEHGDTIELSYLASVRKSVLAMLYGNYVASGRVRLDKTLAELKINDHGGLSPQELEATVADLLAARSGVYHPASNAGDNLADAPPRGSQKHGGYFLYSNWDFNVLGTIFEQETGRNIYDALETDLARPIGMQDFRRDAQRKSGDLTKSIHPAYHMWLSTRDMARLGHLMLAEGSWAGTRVVPRDWVKRITSLITPLADMNPEPLRGGRCGYGFLWWVFAGPKAVGPFEGAYTGRGAGGQFITVLPRLDLVVAHKTNLAKTKNKPVGWDQYLALLDKLVAARD